MLTLKTKSLQKIAFNMARTCCVGESGGNDTNRKALLRIYHLWCLCLKKDNCLFPAHLFEKKKS